MTDEFRPEGEPTTRRGPVIPPAPRVSAPKKPRERLPRLVWREGDCLIYGCPDTPAHPKARWCEQHGGDGGVGHVTQTKSVPSKPPMTEGKPVTTNDDVVPNPLTTNTTPESERN